MSLLNCLEFQTIDADDVPEAHRRNSDNITLDDDFDGSAIEQEWSMIVDDLRKDPDWFTFDNN